VSRSITGVFMLPLFWTDRIPASQQLRIAGHFLRASLPLLAKSQSLSNRRARVDENQSKEQKGSLDSQRESGRE
jgi:hypothetical protein